VSLLVAKNVGVTLQAETILTDVSLAIEAGEIVTIVGPNGSGKSTLLRVLVGALKPTVGEVRRQSGLSIGYVPQKLAIDPTLPLTVNRFLGLPRRQPHAAMDAALTQGGVKGLGNKSMALLSGGQFQRVLLARALLHKPDILLLDEPTQGLDQPGAAAFYVQIESVRDALGCAVIMVSHELHVVMSASDRVICLNGHVCCHGAPEVVASAPEYRALFGLGTQGALALYRHEHDHQHDHSDDHNQNHGHGHNRGHSDSHNPPTGAENNLSQNRPNHPS